MRLAQYLKAAAAKAVGKRATLAPTIDIRKPLEEAAQQVAKEGGATPEWITLAAPLVERFEGMAKLIPGNKVKAYPDPATGGKPWTIGVGSTTDESGNAIKPSDIWTVDRARKRFMAHLAEFGEQVDHLLGDTPTTPAQKAALTSLAYNVGAANLARSSLLRRHKEGKHDAAAKEFGKWVFANGRKMNGLVRRREAEKALYSS